MTEMFGVIVEVSTTNVGEFLTADAASSATAITVSDPTTFNPIGGQLTLNDEVYIEAAQALGRRLVKEGGTTPAERTAYAFRLCLVRPPKAEELSRLVRLFEESKAALAMDARKANQLATMPLGPVPAGMDVTELAAWTVVGNVILNLDETLMKR